MSEKKPKQTRRPRSKEIKPYMVGGSYTDTSNAASPTATRSRRNNSGSIERSDRFKNISDGIIPFNHNKYSSNSTLDVRDAVILCQKAYYNFAIFRSTIDLMTEFSMSDVYFRGGSKKSREFFEAFFKKISLWSIQDKFFREYYRSGNVFLYRFDAILQPKDVRRITQTFGAEADLLAEKTIPARYITLNPSDIQVAGNLTFHNAVYYKSLSDYELARLREPRTEEDAQVLEGLPKEIREQIKKKQTSSIQIPLDNEKITAIFYKKQDYEPLSVPMGYPVLEDLNWKQEMKKMDMAVTRTTQQAILLITMGNEPDKGGVNQKNLENMQKLFVNQSVGRVLVADYTTKADFVIPDIAGILDPKKYDVVDKDIQIGLNNILLGVGERFSNQVAKAEMFLGRLRRGREAFMNDFLVPEIRRISKELGFKGVPTPVFDEINLKDETNIHRIYSRLVEIGVLTPEEALEAFKTGRLPDAEMSVENQKKFQELKEDGLYEPLTGAGGHPNNPNEVKQGKVTVPPQMNGRPPGSTGPQTTKKATPVGQGPQSKRPVSASVNFSVTKVKENMVLSQKLNDKIISSLKRKHKLKKLSEEQMDVVEQISNIIISNEEPGDWLKSTTAYIAKPIDKNKDRVDKVQEVALIHQLDDYMAGILFASRIAKTTEEKDAKE